MDREQPPQPQHPTVYPAHYVDQTPEHLRLIAIFHYVFAGIVALFSFFPIFHFGFGVALATGALPVDDPDDVMGARIAGSVMAGFAGLLMLAGWVFAYLVFLAGRKINRREGYVFILVIAGINCLFAPLGLALSIFTFIVMMRPQALALFGREVTTTTPYPQTTNP